jgi:hypothetical protein
MTIKRALKIYMTQNKGGHNAVHANQMQMGGGGVYMQTMLTVFEDVTKKEERKLAK